MRLRVFWMFAAVGLLAGACSHPHVELDAGAKSKTAAAASGSTSLPLVYGLSRFDPPPPDLVPRMTADQAFAAWTKNGGSKPEGEDSPDIWFALYSDSGSGQMLDNGLTRRDHFKQPVWIVRYRDVLVTPRGGGFAGGVGTRPEPKPVRVDVVGVVDDASGTSVVGITAKPNDPSSAEEARPKSCPTDFSGYTAGLSHVDETPLPGGGSTGTFTQPHAVIFVSDGDVYSVWGGVGSLEHPAAEGSNDGVLVVSHAFKDTCKFVPADEGGIVFHHEPSTSGVVTVTGIAVDSVRFKTGTGTTGTYNVVTESFSSS